ncbi:hypothetical protein HK097_008862 [Rhizophlyctis rosea]|uniref:Uncharacterized protein n=1 Tax=Rhizophlyctis rosea TaxID=64517 RepID=A0AAD5X3N6_9FUNG|nr:hypothetical protein HK097_008862 [Rhizophlyctis rosea]
MNPLAEFDLQLALEYLPLLQARKIPNLHTEFCESLSQIGLDPDTALLKLLDTNPDHSDFIVHCLIRNPPATSSDSFRQISDLMRKLQQKGLLSNSLCVQLFQKVVYRQEGTGYFVFFHIIGLWKRQHLIDEAAAESMVNIVLAGLDAEYSRHAGDVEEDEEIDGGRDLEIEETHIGADGGEKEHLGNGTPSQNLFGVGQNSGDGAHIDQGNALRQPPNSSLQTMGPTTADHLVSRPEKDTSQVTSAVAADGRQSTEKNWMPKKEELLRLGHSSVWTALQTFVKLMNRKKEFNCWVEAEEFADVYCVVGRERRGNFDNKDVRPKLVEWNTKGVHTNQHHGERKGCSLKGPHSICERAVGNGEFEWRLHPRLAPELVQLVDVVLELISRPVKRIGSGSGAESPAKKVKAFGDKIKVRNSQKANSTHLEGSSKQGRGSTLDGSLTDVDADRPAYTPKRPNNLRVLSIRSYKDVDSNDDDDDEDDESSDRLMKVVEEGDSIFKFSIRAEGQSNAPKTLSQAGRAGLFMKRGDDLRAFADKTEEAAEEGLTCLEEGIC